MKTVAVLPILFLTQAFAADLARKPVLLELFTSEGCSSCPPADRLLEAFDRQQPVKGAELIVLSEHVDYWNQLGWTDPYSSSFFTARQNEYAARFTHGGPYTPQLVVDGKYEMVGSDARRAVAAIETAREEKRGTITLTQAVRDGSKVSVHVAVSGLPTTRKAAVYLALAEPEAKSQVARGENAGRALAHVSVVRTMAVVGQISGSESFEKDVAANLKSGFSGPGLRVVVFVQDLSTRQVLGVARAIL